MKFELKKEEYLVFKEFIELNKFDIEIVSVVMDEQLCNLGFTEDVFYTVELSCTEEELERASETALQYEIDAFNTPNGEYPPENDKNYVLYKKFSWIWGLFNGESGKRIN